MLKVFPRSFVMEQPLFQVLSSEGLPWFTLYFLHLNESSLTHPVSLGVDGVYMHLAHLPAVLLTWTHAGLNYSLIGFSRISDYPCVNLSSQEWRK